MATNIRVFLRLLPIFGSSCVECSAYSHHLVNDQAQVVGVATHSLIVSLLAYQMLKATHTSTSTDMPPVALPPRHPSICLSPRPDPGQVDHEIPEDLMGIKEAQEGVITQEEGACSDIQTDSRRPRKGL